MTISDTTPYASVAEADSYFDTTNNHLFCDEWWAANTGAYATLVGNSAYDPNAQLLFTAVTVGTYGNAISIYTVTGGGALACTVSGKIITITLAAAGSTAAQVRTKVLATSAATALVGCALVGTGADAYNDEARVFLWGGIEPDANIYGMKLPSLCLATRRIDDLGLSGRKAVTTQVNEFPRIYVKPDGVEYTQTAVPEEVKQACCEEALALLKYGNTIRYKLKSEGVKSYNDGKFSETLSEEIPQLLSADARRIMKKYCRNNYNIRR